MWNNSVDKILRYVAKVQNKLHVQLCRYYFPSPCTCCNNEYNATDVNEIYCNDTHCDKVQMLCTDLSKTAVLPFLCKVNLVSIDMHLLESLSMQKWRQVAMNSMVSCQKGPTRHAHAWQIGPFWQDTLELLGTIECR